MYLFLDIVFTNPEVAVGCENSVGKFREAFDVNQSRYVFHTTLILEFYDLEALEICSEEGDREAIV